MQIILIAAAAENNAIGKNGQMPWHQSADMKYFKNHTWGLPVLMGRNTFLSLGSKPLPGRLNIILTRRKDFTAEGTVAVHDIEDALFIARHNDYKILAVIGGGEVYKEMMAKADKIFLTRIHTTIPDADTFFPVIDPHKWALASNQDFEADEKNHFAYSFQEWVRK